jgi:hypothetical protein
MFVSSYSSNMTGVTSEAGTAHPSGEPEFTPVLEFVLLDLYGSGVKFSRTFLSVCPFWFGNWISALLRLTNFYYPFSFRYIQTFRQQQSTH